MRMDAYLSRVRYVLQRNGYRKTRMKRNIPTENTLNCKMQYLLCLL